MQNLVLETEHQLVVVTIDPKGYMNLNSLCKACDKRTNAYLKSKGFEDYLKYIKKKYEDDKDLVRDEDGEPLFFYKINKTETLRPGYYAHRLVATDCARWCSPAFAAQVYSYYLRVESGDLSLIPEITKRYDALNSTYSIVVADRDSLLLESKKVKSENEALRLQNQRLLDMLEYTKTFNSDKYSESKKESVFKSNSLAVKEDANSAPLVVIAYDLNKDIRFPEGRAAELNKYISSRYDEQIHGNRIQKAGGVNNLQRDVWYYDRHNDKLNELIMAWMTTL